MAEQILSDPDGEAYDAQIEAALRDADRLADRRTPQEHYDLTTAEPCTCRKKPVTLWPLVWHEACCRFRLQEERMARRAEPGEGR